MGLSRYRDWEARLDAYFRATAERAFVWGGNDCALWACAGIAAETGIDPSAPFRTERRLYYTTDRGAARAMKRFAGGGLAEVAEKIAAEHGAPEVPPTYAGRGDLVLFVGGLGPTLGLVALNGVEVFSAGPEGRFRQLLRELRPRQRLAEGPPGARAWRIG